MQNLVFAEGPRVNYQEKPRVTIFYKLLQIHFGIGREGSGRGTGKRHTFGPRTNHVSRPRFSEGQKKIFDLLKIRLVKSV